jgi:hypothetical protein
MSDNQTENTEEAAAAQQKEKEYNFAQLRMQAEQERNMREQAEQRAQQLQQELESRSKPSDDDDDDDEPYIDRRRLKKELSRFEQQNKKATQSEIQQHIQQALTEERRQMWLKNNPDFNDVMQHAQKFADHDPELAETILEMPDGFERQKLVYRNIKAMGLHKKEEPKPSIQETIDRNRKSPYYQPSGVGSAPYAGAGDFSPSGQKNAYQKMQELKQRLRLG